jgi:hypothetical protein
MYSKKKAKAGPPMKARKMPSDRFIKIFGFTGLRGGFADLRILIFAIF